MVFVTKNLPVSPFLATKFLYRSCHRRRATTLGGQSSVVLSSESIQVNDKFLSVDENNFGPLIDVGNCRLGKRVIEGKKRGKESDYEKLDVFWDDGYGSKSVKDYLDYAKELIKPDGGPPRWFSPVECGCPLSGSPILLFLPGMDSLGWGLVLHHKALGKVFEVRCLHIPVHDRTSFEDLVNYIGESVKIEHKMSPSKPIYLVGDSFGGCLALAVAAKNPTIDLVLVLANPATSFCRSQLQPLFPLFEALPDELHMTVPYLLSIIMGDPLKMALVDVDRTLSPAAVLQQLSEHLTALILRLSVLADIIPKESLLWKLKLLKTASSYANSRLHAVTAEVLVLASGKDNMLPSVDEARRLFRTLKNCEVRNFWSNGHTILFNTKARAFFLIPVPKVQEDGVNLLTVIKGTSKYRRSKRYDFVDDFLPPSMSECKKEIHVYRLYFYATSPVIFSTTENGTIVRGLSGVPSEGPVLLVGYHMLLGLEIGPLLEEFVRERNVMVRGMAHPGLFIGQLEAQSRETFFVDRLKLFGGVPVSPNNLYKLLSTKSFILLYPGGAREALHRKGEAYKLFWPDQPEFVRMAAKFGATIVPFGAVGEDDLVELVLDYDDQIKIPVLNDVLQKVEEEGIRLRKEMDGDIANQFAHIPGVFPKVPGRFYFLFGKPIQTKGMEVLKDKEKAKELYLKIKHEVESNISFLVKKREDDPYRSVVDRTLYQATSVSLDPIPTFDP